MKPQSHCLFELQYPIKTMVRTAVFLLALSNSGFAVDIIDVEDLVDPSSFGGTITSISADGSTVVGEINGGFGNRYGFRWRTQTGVELIHYSSKAIYAEVRGTSDDGELVFLQAPQPAGEGNRIGIWSSNNPDFNFMDYGNRSNDINRIIGNSWYGSILTLQNANRRGSINGNNLGVVSGGYSSVAYGRSGVGENTDSGTMHTRAFDPSLGQFNSDLGVLPGGINSRAYDKSAGITVGQSESTNGLRAFMIPTAGAPMQDLGVLPGKLTSSARTLTEDGYWIFGVSDDAAFIWDSVNGMRDLLTIFIEEGVGGISSWSAINTVDTVYGDSINGYTLTGTGSNGRYIVKGLFAVPEPSSIVLGGASIAILLLVSKKKPFHFGRNAAHKA